MKPTPEQLAEACDALHLIPFYPKEHHSKVLEQIAKFADRVEALAWFVDAAVAGMRQWAGVGELRGLWCTRYKPADGIEADCTLAGHSAADIEAENIAAHQTLVAADRERLESSSAPKLLAAAAHQHWSNPEWEANLPPLLLYCLNRYRQGGVSARGLLSAARVQTLQPEENYQPPDWLINLG